MNREQRRREQKQQKKQRNKKSWTAVDDITQPDFSAIPLATMCQSIQLLINELQQRGYPVYDFDNKTKYVQGIQIIQGKVFFLAAEEVSNHEKT